MLKRALLLGAYTALFGMGISLIPWVDRLETEWGLSWLFKLRGPRAAPSDVVMVLIDHQSFRHFGLKTKSSLWSREHHANLVDVLNRGDARVIIFDLILDEPRDRLHDRLLANAVKKAGNVVLFQYLKRESAPGHGLDGVALNIEKLVSPIPELAQAATALAPFPLPKAPANVAQVWTFKRGAGDAPTMPAVALQLFAMSLQNSFITLVSENAAEPGLLQLKKNSGIDLGSDTTQLVKRVRSLFLSDENLKHRLSSALKHTENDETRSIYRALFELYSGQHSRFLDFYGPPQTISTIPYHKVLSEESGFDFKDKAVFIGFSAQLDPKDGFYTVYTDPEGLGMSGVEIVATSFANLLERREIAPLSFDINLLILFSWGLTIGALLMLLPGYHPVIASGVLVVAYTWIASYWFVRNGTWLPLMVPIVFQMIFALLCALLWHYFVTRQENATMLGKFRVYLPEQVIEGLVKGGKDNLTEGQLVKGICLATDVAQYTALSETLPPESLRILLNRYYRILFQPVTDHGGFVSDVVGDSMLAIWASTSDDPSQRAKACLAAIEILRDTDAFNRGLPNQQLPTRIGLHGGDIVLGNVGAGDHFEYRAVGDIVNAATRIEALNKYLGTRLLASQAVVKELDSIGTRNLGDFVLMGKAKPIKILELISNKEFYESSRRELHARFEAALHFFQEGHWNEARSHFSRILECFPHDGPSLFYYRLANNYADNPPSGPWDGVVILSEK